MLLYRVLSAVVGIPVVLAAVWYGGVFLSGLVLIIALLGIVEMARLWAKMGVRIWLPGAILGGALFVLAAAFAMPDYTGAAFFITLAAAAVYMIMVYPDINLSGLAATFFTPLYAGWLLAHIIHLRDLPGGFHFVVILFAATWSTDTFAYFVGMNFGRHKLAPVISPNKSVEGSVGGLFGSVLVMIVFWWAVGRLSLPHYIVLGLLVGFTGQAGDLLESAYKRLAGVKDSGRLIPGHGGILDRFDSLYLAAPAVFYYLQLFKVK